MKPRISSAVQGLAALAVLALAVPAASAQENHPVFDKEKQETVKVVLTGSSVLDYIMRSRELTAYLDNPANRAIGSPIGNAANSRQGNTFEGYAAIGLVFTLKDNVEGVVEVGTTRYDGNFYNNPPGVTEGGVNEFGNFNSEEITLRRLLVSLNEVFGQGVVVRLGLPEWMFDIRGNGQPFAFGPRGSQTVKRNFDSVGQINIRTNPDAPFIEGMFIDPVQPVGGHASYTTGNLVIDLVLLPAVLEGGQADGDESIYAIDAIQGLKDLAAIPGRVGLILVANNFRSAPGNNSHARVFTLGGGTSLNVTTDIELFGEVYVQSGKAGEDGVGNDIDAGGMAYQIGILWTHTVGNPMPIHAGASYFRISGDGDTATTDDTADRFSAYEGVDELLIIESHDYGFDWDSNITGFKVNAGTAFSVLDENDLSVDLVIGILQTDEEVGLIGGVTEDALGNELDLKLNWSLTEQFSLKFAVGLLQGSDVLELAMDSGVPGSNPNSSDSASMYLFGFDVSF